MIQLISADTNVTISDEVNMESLTTPYPDQNG